MFGIIFKTKDRYAFSTVRLAITNLNENLFLTFYCTVHAYYFKLSTVEYLVRYGSWLKKARENRLSISKKNSNYQIKKRILSTELFIHLN